LRSLRTPLRPHAHSTAARVGTHLVPSALVVAAGLVGVVSISTGNASAEGSQATGPANTSTAISAEPAALSVAVSEREQARAALRAAAEAKARAAAHAAAVAHAKTVTHAQAVAQSKAVARANAAARARAIARANAAARGRAAAAKAAASAKTVTRATQSESVAHPAVSGRAGQLNWAALAQCEATGNPRAYNPAGYYGLYQFDVQTWQSMGGAGLPSNASPAEQTYRAQLLFKQRGSSAWPVCGARLFS